MQRRNDFVNWQCIEINRKLLYQDFFINNVAKKKLKNDLLKNYQQFSEYSVRQKVLEFIVTNVYQVSDKSNSK